MFYGILFVNRENSIQRTRETELETNRMADTSSSSTPCSDKDELSDAAVRSLEESLEDLNFRDKEELTPIVTQFKTIVFSQHENSVKVIKEHQYLLNTVLLMKQQIKQENDKLRDELKNLLVLDPNEMTFVYSSSGNFYIKQASHTIRKRHETRLSNNLRKLQCLETKLSYLELIVLQEKAVCRSRANDCTS